MQDSKKVLLAENEDALVSTRTYVCVDCAPVVLCVDKLYGIAYICTYVRTYVYVQRYVTIQPCLHLHCFVFKLTR